MTWDYEAIHGAKATRGIANSLVHHSYLAHCVFWWSPLWRETSCPYRTHDRHRHRPRKTDSGYTFPSDLELIIMFHRFQQFPFSKLPETYCWFYCQNSCNKSWNGSVIRVKMGTVIKVKNPRKGGSTMLQNWPFNDYARYCLFYSPDYSPFYHFRSIFCALFPVHIHHIPA